jgi:hypothetical protein
MALQKIFLLPPLKGLNLYDNPFTMSPDYAVALDNFMPPTTTFTVRPGVKRIMQLDGQVKGIYSYVTGSVMDYGGDWFDSNVSYGAASLLLIKLTKTDGTTNLSSVNVTDPNPDTAIKNLGDVANSYYNDDCAINKHTMFFVSGAPNSAAYLYHQAKGLATFALAIGEDGHQSIGNLSNITIFKGYIFFSTGCSTNIDMGYQDDDGNEVRSDNALNIFFIETKYADILDPLRQSWWNGIENFFSPHYGSCFSLDGILQNGGNIIKMCNISRSGSDSLSTYLAIITDQGEIVLYDGAKPGGDDWKVMGKFQIPPPLNKWAFADMEGDLVVVTQNGLVSLRRVIFGQTTNITENLEYKLMSIFKDYMFQIPAFSQFVGLFYHSRNRLLIFNVPTDLPMPFNQIVTSYNFDTNKSLVFGNIERDPDDINTPSKMEKYLINFVINYIAKNCLDYNLIIELNGDSANSYIRLGFNHVGNPPFPVINGKTPITIEFDFVIKETSDSTEYRFLENKVKFDVDDIGNIDSPVTMTTDLKWNPEMYDYGSNQTIYKFKHGTPAEPLIVTNILPSVAVFYKRKYADSLGRHNPTYTIPNSKMTISDSFYNLNSNFKSSIYDVFVSKQNGYYKDINIKTLKSPYYNEDIYKVSFLKLIVYAFAKCLTYFGHYPYSNCLIEWTYKCPLYIKYKDGSTSPFDIEVVYTLSNDFPSLQWIVNVSIKLLGGENESAPFLSCEYEIVIYPEISETFNIFDVTCKAFSVQQEKEISLYDLNPIFEKGDVESCWTVDIKKDDGDKVYINFITDYMESILPNKLNDTDITKTVGWYLYNCGLDIFIPPDSTPSKATGDDDPSPQFTNVDLKTIPLLSVINITCNFGSIQYVFDSHFGTWSTFSGINMLRGIEHQNDFYFIIPDDISYVDTSSQTLQYVITKSTLCKFEQHQGGDMTIVPLPGTTPTFQAIQCQYKTVPTFDFGMPQKKIFKRLKIFGNPSVFWQIRDMTQKQKFPLVITPFWDFKEGTKTAFIHSFDGNAMSERILKKHFEGRQHHELSFGEKEKFWKLYKEENDMLAFVNIPIVANPATRFGLQIDMVMMEMYMNIYGFEVYFEPLQQIL